MRCEYCGHDPWHHHTCEHCGAPTVPRPNVAGSIPATAYRIEKQILDVFFAPHTDLTRYINDHIASTTAVRMH